MGNLGCRRLKRSETVGTVQLAGKLEMHLGVEHEVMSQGERKRRIDDLAEEGDESYGRQSKALCCDPVMSEEVAIITSGASSVLSSGALEEDDGEIEKTLERKAERVDVGAEDTEENHYVVPVTCLPINFSGEVELMSF